MESLSERYLRAFLYLDSPLWSKSVRAARARRKNILIRHSNERSNLNFRELLRKLDGEKVTSRELASKLGRPVKEISNDLRRLRRMGFVKADREKRMCASRWIMRRNYYRGFQYGYYLSEQGKSYLNWMNKVRPTEDNERSVLMKEIAAHLPSNLKNAILAYHFSRGSRKYKKHLFDPNFSLIWPSPIRFSLGSLPPSR